MDNYWVEIDGNCRIDGGEMNSTGLSHAIITGECIIRSNSPTFKLNNIILSDYAVLTLEIPGNITLYDSKIGDNCRIILFTGFGTTIELCMFGQNSEVTATCQQKPLLSVVSEQKAEAGWDILLLALLMTGLLGIIKAKHTKVAPKHKELNLQHELLELDR